MVRNLVTGLIGYSVSLGRLMNPVMEGTNNSRKVP
jgi:hypothetical protein